MTLCALSVPTTIIAMASADISTPLTSQRCTNRLFPILLLNAAALIPQPDAHKAWRIPWKYDSRASGQSIRCSPAPYRVLVDGIKSDAEAYEQEQQVYHKLLTSF